MKEVWILFTKIWVDDTRGLPYLYYIELINWEGFYA